MTRELTVKEFAAKAGTTVAVINGLLKKGTLIGNKVPGSYTKVSEDQLALVEEHLKHKRESKIKAFNGNDIIFPTPTEPQIPEQTPGLTIFENQDFGQVRTIIKDGEPWFVAKDICDILEHTNVSMAISRLDDDEKDITTVYTLGGNQQINIINESGLYSLILTSRKHEAKAFKKWLTSEVIPSIRKTGGYGNALSLQDQLKLQLFSNDPTIVSNAHQQLLALETKPLLEKIEQKEEVIQEKEQVIQEQQPKVEVYHKLIDSKTAMDLGTFAKIVGEKGLGRNKLFAFLRSKNVLDKNNRPYKTFIDNGRFIVKEIPYTDKNGQTHINVQTLITPKGQEWVLEGLKKFNLASGWDIIY